MKTLLQVIVGLCVLGLAGLIAGYGLMQGLYNQKLDNTEQLIYIPKGAGVAQIAYILKSNEIIDNVDYFKLSARIFHDPKALKAGEYQIRSNTSLAEILSVIEKGETFQRLVTIPEGLTGYQVKKLLLKGIDVKGDQIGAGSSIDIGEGDILPDTYAYNFNDTPEDILNRMRVALTDFLDKEWENRAPDTPVKTKEEALILASIVEKETAVPSEYGRVAGVFANRLRIGMALQTDPTVIYAITKGVVEDKGQGPLGRRLLKKDLNFDSPYNTYIYPGLPPGPICNPGRAAIKATLNPDKHAYLYFVADGTGGHAFGKTLEEHNQNVQKWRKIRRSQN